MSSQLNTSSRITHKFVNSIPEQLEEGVIYISLKYSTALHSCCCGCGNEVVTPITPIDWSLIYNGESITLEPSVGNWNFKCRSHYVIENNEVKFLTSWNSRQIDLGRSRDLYLKNRFFEHRSDIKILQGDSEYSINVLTKIKQIFAMFHQWFSTRDKR